MPGRCAPVNDPGVSEDPQERLNRELIELLNELRVVLPGVQVLFAFLLTIPFAKGFPRLDRLDRNVYFAGLLATVVSSALLIAPSAYHRFVWRQHDKEELLETSNWFVILGMGALALAMCCAIFVITDFLFGAGLAIGVTIGTAVTFAGLWYALPLTRRAKLEGRTPTRPR